MMITKYKRSVGIALVLVLCALPIVWLSGTTWDSTTDDLLPTLISIENWRLFFWGFSRFGTLVPLLAKPFTDMRSNLLFQNSIHAVSLIVFVYALSRVFYRNRTKSANRTLVFVLLVFLFSITHLVYLELLISGLPYAAPLGIFGLSLLIVNSNLKRIIIVPILIIFTAVSCWVNPLNGYYLAPLLLVFLSLKKFKNVFYELTLSYLLVNFGIFFVILGLANGETGGTVTPNFRPFQIYHWWILLFAIQGFLVLRAIIRREFKKNQFSYLSFLLTWVSIFALTSLRHIHNNGEATRYFITAAFVSMCITMKLLEELIFEIEFVQVRVTKFLDFFSKKRVLSASVLALLLANVLISQNLVSDFPLQQPQKKLMGEIFKSKSEPYRFASGDFWYAWTTKIYMDRPEDIFVTAWESEFQYDTATDSKKAIQSRLKDGDLGLCFGKVRTCEREIRTAAFRMYGAFKVEVKVTDSYLITKEPTLVHSLRLSITSKKSANF